MGRNTAIILLSFVGLFTIVSLADAIASHAPTPNACKCNINHPQERFCKAAFVFVGKITDTTYAELEGVIHTKYTFTYSQYQVYKGKHLLNENRFNQTVYTPYHGLCGRSNLHTGNKYLMSGYVEHGNLKITYCDWVKHWEEITETQRYYLKYGIYASNCGQCEIPGTVRFNRLDQNLHTDYSNDIQMSGYWTLRMCYYNPIASLYFQSTDCEGELSYCSYDEEAGMCLWKWSGLYTKCFTERETLWQILSGAQPAFTGISQCRTITSKKLKKKCKRAVQKTRKLRRREREQEEERQAQEQEVQLPFDVDY